MDRRDWYFLMGLMGVMGLILILVGRGGAITIERAGAVLRTVVILCLAWLLLESVQ